DRDGLTGIKQISKAFPNILLIVLSGHFGKPDVDEALAIGVNGFVGKTSRGASLVNIIHLVQAGETYLPSEMARAHSFNRSQPSVPSLANPLTQREIEVLSHLASGYSNKLIARQLNVEESTIKTHVKSLYRKLAVSNRIEAAKMAMKLQLPEVAIG
ncbi:MAG: response regulator transcription factor, partial [Psychrosphaera sp.]|nr:response regulator transcription factor [Psychrosphaera sp.]